jgi:hypothetical protein
MAAAPAYAANPRSIDIAQISAANTNRDGTGTIVTVCAGVAAGTRVSSVTVKATVTTTAGMVRIYLSTDTGTTWRLYREIPVSAITASASVATFYGRLDFEDLVLTGVSDLLGASTHNAEAFNILPAVMDL